MITKDSRNILVADDSMFFRTKLSDILIEGGHNVRFAQDGDEVINEIRVDSNWINLLALDLMMPGKDGFEVLRWMDEHGMKGRFPVLVITSAYEASDVLDNLRRLGAAGFMPKGASPEQVIFRVNRLLFPDKATAGTNPRRRIPVSLAVDFRSGDVARTGYLLNISETGTFLHTDAELATGSVVKMKFSLPGNTRVLDVFGTVSWSSREIGKMSFFAGYGIEFGVLSPDDTGIIREFIERETKKLGPDVEPAT